MVEASEYRKLYCVDCSVEFSAVPNRGRPRIRCTACSPTRTARPGAYATDRARVAACDRCAKEFTATHGGAKYCSVGCRVAAGNQMAQVRRRDRTSRNCKQCGEAFAPTYGDRRNVFCSDRCIKSAHNERTSGSTHIRRARRFGCEIESVDVFTVFERDAWSCYLCGCDTPRALRGTSDDQAPELEHVVPLAKRGAHAYANVRCSCRSCNRRKGTKFSFELTGGQSGRQNERPTETDRKSVV